MGVGQLIAKRRGVIDLDVISVGRRVKDTSHPNSVTFSYEYSTGSAWDTVRGKKIQRVSEIPSTLIERGIASPNYGEGFDILLPRRKGSPGWRLFIDLPIMKVKQIQHEILMLKYEYSKLVETNKGIKDPAQVLEFMATVGDLIQELSKKAEVVSAEAMSAIPPRPTAKPGE